jgi:hypothetical protein
MQRSLGTEGHANPTGRVWNTKLHNRRGEESQSASEGIKLPRGLNRRSHGYGRGNRKSWEEGSSKKSLMMLCDDEIVVVDVLSFSCGYPRPADLGV